MCLGSRGEVDADTATRSLAQRKESALGETGALARLVPAGARLRALTLISQRAFRPHLLAGHCHHQIRRDGKLCAWASRFPAEALAIDFKSGILGPKVYRQL